VRHPLSQAGCEAALSPIRIIGVGSPLGCDSVGWQAVDALQEMGLIESFPPEVVTMEKLDRPGAGLLEYIRGADQVFIIDALVGAGDQGAMVVLHAEDLMRESSPLSGHGLGVAEAMALGEALGDLPTNLQLLGIPVDSAAETLSDMQIKPETITELWEHICQQIALVYPQYTSKGANSP